jgi:hypothetical protein
LIVRTNRSAWAFKFGERGGSFHGVHSGRNKSPENPGSEQRVAVVNQISLPTQEPVHIIAEVPGNLFHPESIRFGGYAGDLNTPRRDVDQKEYQEPC